MAEAYAKLIMAGKKTMADVPSKLKKAVQKILDEQGWDDND